MKEPPFGVREFVKLQTSELLSHRIVPRCEVCGERIGNPFYLLSFSGGVSDHPPRRVCIGCWLSRWALGTEEGGSSPRGYGK